jgi:hypothetical protein
LLGPFFPWLRELLARRPAPTPPAAPIGGSPLFPVGADRTIQPISLSFQSFFFWGLILLLVIILYLRMRRRAISLPRDAQDEPESLLKRGEARKLLRKALQDAIGNLAAALRPIRKAIIAARIRRIYTQLLDLCRDLQRPRPAAKTPLEFLPDMGELFTTLAPELDLITQTYVRVRYGETPETSAEVEAVEAAWRLVNAEGQRLKRAGQGKLKTVEVRGVERPGV